MYPGIYLDNISYCLNKNFHEQMKCIGLCVSMRKFETIRWSYFWAKGEMFWNHIRSSLKKSHNLKRWELLCLAKILVPFLIMFSNDFFFSNDFIDYLTLMFMKWTLNIPPLKTWKESKWCYNFFVSGANVPLFLKREQN